LHERQHRGDAIGPDGLDARCERPLLTVDQHGGHQDLRSVDGATADVLGELGAPEVVAAHARRVAIHHGDRSLVEVAVHDPGPVQYVQHAPQRCGDGRIRAVADERRPATTQCSCCVVGRGGAGAQNAIAWHPGLAREQRHQRLVFDLTPTAHRQRGSRQS
jgi:hypothetical protein